MSVLTQNFDWIFLSGVFAASLAGSLHCAGMCGGLALTATHGGQRGFQALYNLARLTGYMAVGAAAGGLGRFVLGGQLSQAISWIAVIIISTVFLWSAYQTLQGKSGLPVPAFIRSAGASLLPRALQTPSPFLRPLAVGFFSVLLPCGWLYSFVLTAVATQSLWKGATVLFVFWTGTVPALVFGSWVVQRAVAPYRAPLRKALALVFVAMGAWSIWVKTNGALHNRPMSAATAQGPGAEACHHHHM